MYVTLTYLSKALTRPKSFLLFLQWANVWGRKLPKCKNSYSSPAIDENLGVVLHRVCEDPERPSWELLLLLGLPFLRGHVCLAGHPDGQFSLWNQKHVGGFHSQGFDELHKYVAEMKAVIWHLLGHNSLEELQSVCKVVNVWCDGAQCRQIGLVWMLLEILPCTGNQCTK